MTQKISRHRIQEIYHNVCDNPSVYLNEGCSPSEILKSFLKVSLHQVYIVSELSFVLWLVSPLLKDLKSFGSCFPEQDCQSFTLHQRLQQETRFLEESSPMSASLLERVLFLKKGFITQIWHLWLSTYVSGSSTRIHLKYNSRSVGTYCIFDCKAIKHGIGWRHVICYFHLKGTCFVCYAFFADRLQFVVYSLALAYFQLHLCGACCAESKILYYL